MIKTMKGRDSLMKKLLSAPNIHGMMSGASSFGEGLYNAPSPANDAVEESCTKLSRFLSQLAKESGREINMVMLDHAYSRPGDWSPENTYLKPTKKLFTFNFSPAENLIQKEDIDVEAEPTVLIPPYNKEVTSRLMRECETFVNNIRYEDKRDEWEEQIDKSSWTPQQIRLFNKVLRTLNQDHLSRLVCEGSPSEAVKRRVIVDTTARRLRQLLASVNWETRLVQWLHTTLLDTLCNAYLAAYLDALQTLKAKIPVLIERLTHGSSTRPGATDALNIIMKHPWDPVFECLSENKPRRLPGNPIMLVVPSHPVLGGTHSPRMRQWELYLSALGTVVTVVLKAGNETSKASLSTCLDQMLCAARMKTAQVRAEYPGKPVILVGWNAGASIATQVALLEQVQAVVCMGFSVDTLEGKRGEPNDTLLDIRCPVFFVIGENAAASRCEDIEEIRERMRVETGLVVVGGADDQLRMSKLTKFRGGVTQTMVDYCIMDEVAEFLGTLLITPRPQLRPISNHTVSAANSIIENGVTVKMDGKRKQTVMEVATTAGKRPRTDITLQTGNSATNPATSMPDSSPKSSLSTLPTFVSVGSTGSVKGRQKPRLIGMQKLQGSQESKWMTQKAVSDQGVTSNGITVNIGSLGSLTPLGPLRLGHATGSQPQRPSEAERQPVSRGRGNGGSSLTSQGGVISSGSLVGLTDTRMGGRSSGKTSIGLQGKQVRGMAVTPTVGKTIAENQLTSLSSLLQSGTARLVVSSASSLLLGQASSTVAPVTTTAGQQVKAQSSGTRVRTTSGRVVDLSKLTVLTSGSSGIASTAAKNALGTTVAGNVVMLTSASSTGGGVRGQQVLVPVSGSQSFTVLPRQRSYAVVPKISVPSLKLSNEQQLSHTGGRLSGYTLAPTLPKNTHQREESSVTATATAKHREDDDTLTPDKILELPIIFAKDGDNLFLDAKPESGVTEPSSVVPVSVEGSLQQKVTMADTITFPLDDTEREGILQTKPCNSVTNMPNVYIIRSNRGRGRGGRRYIPKAQRLVPSVNKATHISGSQSQGVKYTKIILTNKSSPLKIGEMESQESDTHSLQQKITCVDSDQSSEEGCDSPLDIVRS